MGIFVTGNSWWLERTKHGRDALFTEPEKLLEAAKAYFEFTQSRTWDREDWVGKDATKVVRKSTPPFTITGLCVYLGVAENYWRAFKSTETYKNNPDFATVFAHIEQTIYMQKFEGASVGAFNANIIARDLGLKDASSTELKTPEDGKFEVTLKLT